MQKKVYLICALSLALGLAATGSALADGARKRANYVQGQIGFFVPDSDLDDSDFDEGGVFGLSYGRYLTDIIKIEAGWDVYAFERDSSGTNATLGYYEQDDVLVASGLAVSLLAEFPAGPVNFYGGGGVGVYGVQLSSEIDSQLLGSFDSDEDDSVFGAHLVLGANFDISKQFFMGLEGKYRWTSDVDINETVASIPVNYEGDMSGFSVALTGGWRF